MLFSIDSKSGKPVYLQLVDQIRYAAASGALRPGEALPSIRPLAGELHVNRNTVAKAYAELESMGVIETVGGKGCFLRENNSPLSHEARQKLLSAKLDEAVVTAHQMQVDAGELLTLLAERLRFFERKNAEIAAPGKEPVSEPTDPSSPSPISTPFMESWTPSMD
jgi:GntR family transcriptional regulator